MDEDQNDIYSDSEDEVDSKRHSQLLEDLVGLDSKQPLKRPTRTEPTIEISEYNLVKSIAGRKGSVKLHELTKPLRTTATHAEISKSVRRTDRKTKTLERPLERPQADRIRRAVAYERTKEEISRWEPVVTGHRASTYLSFPLDYSAKVEIDAKRSVEWKVKSDVERAVEEIERGSAEAEVYEVEPETEAPLTLEEMMERRRELAKLRRFQSYHEIKARMQNKIKSKRYRRVVRKERAKRQVKEFEALQRTDPEEALKKLDEIEKCRAQERASLRHKSTSKWAKNHQIRAKYDKESRQVLAEQLAISKELTQKKCVESSDDSEDERRAEKEESPKTDGDLEFNFWITRTVPTVDERNAKSDGDVTHEYTATANEKDANVIPGENVTTVQNKAKKRRRKRANEKPKKVEINVVGMSGEWAVDDAYIDNLASKLEDKLRDKVAKRSRKIKRTLDSVERKNCVEIDKGKKKTPDLTIKKVAKRPIIDEQLQETDKSGKPINNNEKLETLKSILNSKVPDENPTNGIEPNKYLKAPVDLESDAPNLFSTNDNEENADIRGVIAEAFEDEDIAEDFARDKEVDVDNDAPKDIDLFLPGWGSWGGTNIRSTMKRKRFVTKLPKDLPRRDKNKRDVIVNERASKAIKPHMVSEIPFPFKSVRDYEASVRAPIGSTFVPETAFRRLTKPGVTTRLGAVIDPIDEDVLMRKMRRMEKVMKVKK